MQEVREQCREQVTHSQEDSQRSSESSSSSEDSEEEEDREGLYDSVASYVVDSLVAKTEDDFQASNVCTWLKEYGTELGLSSKTSDFVKAWWQPGATCEEMYDKSFSTLFKLILPAVQPIVEDLLKRELLTHSSFLGICQRSLQLLPIQIHAQSQAQLIGKITRLIERHVEGAEDVQDATVAVEVEHDLVETMDSIVSKSSNLDEEMDWVETRKEGLSGQLGLMVLLLSGWQLRLFRQL